MSSHRIVPRGPFSLRAAAVFGFGPNEGAALEWDGAMRLAFPLDGGAGYAGAVLRQREGDDGPVEVELQTTAGADVDAALAQVARTVSLDHDGEAFLAVGERDPVLGALQRALPGQRPVLFPSPYEAAAWGVLSARRPTAQGATVRAALGRDHGASFELVGQTLHAFPQPDALAAIPDAVDGLNATKVKRLRGVAASAQAGQLDVARLHELGPERADEDVQTIAGIGPFYAGLIVLRASGFADALAAVPEAKGAAFAAHYYGLEQAPDGPAFAALAERWRPFRTWAAVLIRLAGARGVEI